jgi:dolichol-phosphate mannosyltransferase
VTILAPAYNEEEVIEDFVKAVLSVIEVGWELLIVDDGSTDRTPDLLFDWAGSQPEIRVLTHPVNRGVGAALATGFTAAAGDVVVTIDADQSHPLHLIPDLVSGCADAEAVFASRYVPGGGMTGVPAVRRWISRLGNVALRLLFLSPVRDLTTGFRAYRTDLIRNLRVESPGFEAQLEITVRLLAHGAQISETPLILENRSAGQSKMRYLTVVPRYVRLLPKLLWIRWRGPAP